MELPDLNLDADRADVDAYESVRHLTRVHELVRAYGVLVLLCGAQFRALELGRDVEAVRMTVHSSSRRRGCVPS